MNSNYGWALPVAASTYASKIDHSLMILHVVMVLVFVLWAIYMAYCLVRYRHREGQAATYSHKTPLSSYVPDILMLLFEVWLIFIIGVPLWAHIREKLPPKEDATVINVVAQQFSWLAHYPGPDGIFGKQSVDFMNADNPVGLDEKDSAGQDDFVLVDQIIAPIGKPVLINLSSKDVIHSFFVPEFRMKQDAVPGMKIPVWVEPTQTGQFEIACAQLCGAAHYRMRGDFFVKPADEYQLWLEGQMNEKNQRTAAVRPVVTENWE